KDGPVRRRRGRERREVRRQGIRQTGNHLLDWKGILGNGPRDPSALKVPERHPSAPDLRPRGQGQCRLDPSHGKVWVHDFGVQQRIRERARQRDRGSHLGAEWTYGELRTDATAGYSSRQTRGPSRTPEPQFLVAPEEEGEPEGERQEPGGHRDRAKAIVASPRIGRRPGSACARSRHASRKPMINRAAAAPLRTSPLSGIQTVCKV